MSAERTFIPLDALKPLDINEQLPPISVEQLFVASYYGECKGVKGANEVLDQLDEIIDGREPYYSPRLPTHNRVSNQRHIDRGLIVVKDRILRSDGRVDYDLSKIPDGAIYIKTAHGSTDGDDEAAREKGLYVVDLTCPLVEANENLGKTLVKRGFTILFHGAREKDGLGYHPETRAFLENVKGEVVPFSDFDEFDNIGLDPERIYAIMSQTTMLQDVLDKVIERALEKDPNIRISKHLVCYATENRQAAMAELTRFTDFNMVITAPESNNGGELIAKSILNGVPCDMIQTFNDIPWDKFSIGSSIKKVGLTSAASTPNWLLEQVIRQFERKGVEIVRLIPNNPEDSEASFHLSRANLERLQERYRLWPSPREAEKVVGYNT